MKLSPVIEYCKISETLATARLQKIKNHGHFMISIFAEFPFQAGFAPDKATQYGIFERQDLRTSLHSTSWQGLYWKQGSYDYKLYECNACAISIPVFDPSGC